MSGWRPSSLFVVAVFTLGLILALAGYLGWSLVDFNSRHALSESLFLEKYAERHLTRYQANPAHFWARRAANPALQRLDVVDSFDQLRARFPGIPAADAFAPNHTRAVLLDYRGLFKVPNYLLVRALPVEGRIFYAYLLVDERFNDAALDWRALESVQPALWVGVFAILLLVMVELVHIHKARTSMANFADWASQLHIRGQQAPMPHFADAKFNYLAFAIDKSLSGVTRMLAQEQSFATFTSHELRTPIAVLSSNLELLELLMKDLSPQERHLLRNMESAVQDMKYQMDALLWLSREADATDGQPAPEWAPADLDAMVHKAVRDNRYLLEGRAVQVYVQGSGSVVLTHVVMAQIVLNNLVRNAYQHTAQGRVDIKLFAGQVSIQNQHQGDSELRTQGFGIGLALVEKLVAKLQLDYQVDLLPDGRCVRLQFPLQG